jgi:hypothetical protein
MPYNASSVLLEVHLGSACDGSIMVNGNMQNAAGVLVAGSLAGALYLKNQEVDDVEEGMR